MATQGPLGPGTGTNVLNTGTRVSWINPGNITSQDSSGATVTLAGFSGFANTHYLQGTNFGFTIPVGATINGILVEILVQETGTATANDLFVNIIKGGVVGATNKASATNYASSYTYRSYGGSSDLWGETWTYSDINASNFGASLASQRSGGGPKATAPISVDYMRITIDYTVGGVTNSSFLNFM